MKYFLGKGKMMFTDRFGIYHELAIEDFNIETTDDELKKYVISVMLLLKSSPIQL
jgi:hypothetical protein